MNTSNPAATAEIAETAAGLAALPDAALLFDPQGRIRAANELAGELLACPCETLRTKCLADLATGLATEPPMPAAAAPDPTASSRRHRTRWRRADGRSIGVDIAVGDRADGCRLALVRALPEPGEDGASAQRNYALYHFLIHANAMLARASDVDALYRELCSLATEIDRRIVLAWVALIAADNRDLRLAAAAGIATGYVEGIRISLDAGQAEGNGPAARAIREGRCVILNDFLGDPQAQPWHERARRHGIRAGAAIPLVDMGRPVGALMLYSSEAAAFDAEFERLLVALGENISRTIGFLRQRQENAQTLETLRRSEGLYRLLAENIRDVIWIFDVETGRFDYISPSFEALSGYTAPEAMQRGIDDLLTVESAAAAHRIVSEDVAAWHAGSFRSRTAELELLQKDGGTVWTEVSTRMQVDPESGHLRILGVTRDIGERRAIARRLAENEFNLRAILDAADETIVMIGVSGRLLAINQIGAKRLGSTPPEMIGTNLYDYLPPAVAAFRRDRIGQIVASQQPAEFEDQRDGRTFRSRVYPIHSGEPRAVIFASDVTELRAAEAERQSAEGRFRDIVELSTEGIAMTDAGGHVSFANRRMHEMLGLPDDQLPGRMMLEFIAPEDRRRFFTRFADVRRNPRESTRQAQYTLLHADGRRLKVLLSATHLTGAAGEYAGSIGMVTDITDLFAAEQALRNALNVLESSPGVGFRWLARDDWPVDYVSNNVARWGYAPERIVAGDPSYAAMVHPDDLARVAAEVTAQTAAGLGEYTQTYRLRAADGHYFWVEDHTRVVRNASGAVVCYEGVVTDIDDKKRAEQNLEANLARQRELNHKLEEAHNQLLQSEKMASIGQLAAGVAHELNNPIGFVHSNLGTLERYLQDIFEIARACESAAATAANAEDFARIEALKQEKDFDYMKSDIFQLMSESKDGLNRVKKIVQDLKDFSRVGEAEWQWADLHAGLDSTLNIVWNELKYKCTVTKDYAADLPQIHCLPSQLNQVFMNLLVNSAQAIETRGEITIRTERSGDDAVRISIGDNGKGIPAENMSRLFEPFFTTKPVGKGTGLGLSIAYGIIGKHKGRIEVDSQVGVGTTFTITLPIE